MENHYLYHWVPKGLQGTILYPLNILKEIFPEAYARAASKYENRKELMEVNIPLFDCKWNDVLHFSAINPRIVLEKFREAGFTPPPIEYFQIPVSMLDQKNMIAFFLTIKGTSVPHEAEWFNIDHFEKYATFPNDTFEYYKQRKLEGRKTLLYAATTHIFYKGNIETKDLTRITV